MKNRIIYKRISIMLIVALVLTGAFSFPLESFGGTEVVSSKTYYRLTTGVVHTWGIRNNKGVMEWQQGYGPGSSYPIHLSESLGEGMENVKVYVYDDSIDVDWNALIKPSNNGNYSSQQLYKDKYLSHSGKPHSISVNYNETSGSLKYDYKVELTESQKFNAKAMLNNEGYPALKALLGYISPEQEKLINQVQAGTGEGVEGWLWFVPLITEYTEVVRVDTEKPRAILNLPETAAVGATFTAADGPSYIPKGTTLKSSLLEKNEGSGWQKLSGWNGKAIDQSSDREGTINYRLTITLTNGDSDSEIKTIAIDDGRTMDAAAHLALPPYTYEGHPVLAEDESDFTINGVEYSAERAYMEGAASNKFELVQPRAGKLKRLQKRTEAEATFEKRGNYDVRLTVNPKGGERLYDQKPIEVKKTPGIIANLNGVQKQNRKQVLNIQVAVHPDYPLTDMWVEVESLSSGEKVHLDNHVGSEAAQGNALGNTERIKTRPIERLSSDQYFTNCKLEFLTKNSAEEQYRYIVYAKDTKGETDQVERVFTVVPDEPPEASVDIAGQFIRDKGTNVAELIMEDGSHTDGDQIQRSWTVAYDSDQDGSFDRESRVPVKNMPGYADLSFGTGKKVQFSRTGVGRVQVHLLAKEVWTEETLPEYISDSDYLTGSAIGETEVINIAPVVSLKPIQTKTADILMLATGEEEYSIIKNAKNLMVEKLLQNGIDARLTIQRVTPQASDISRGTTQNTERTARIGTPFGHQGGWSFLEQNSFIVDEGNLYVIQATWEGSKLEHLPKAPYYIRAYDCQTGLQKWVYTLTESTMKVDTGYNTSFAQDDGGKYLFLRSGGKTLVLEKENGAFLSVLNISLGDSSTIGEEAIYSFKNDGIYRINMQNGAISRVYTAAISGKAERSRGKLIFITSNGNSVFRSSFDPLTEKVSLMKLPGTEGDTPGLSYQLLGADTEGKLVVRCGGTVRVYSSSNQLLQTFGVGEAQAVLPVCDEYGVCNTVVWTNSNSGSKYSHVYGYLGDVETGAVISATETSGSYVTNPEQVIFAKQLGNLVIVICGGEWGKVYGTNTSLGQYTDELAYVCTFNLDKKTASWGNANTIHGYGSDISAEYGRWSGAYAVLASQDNIYDDSVQEGSQIDIVSWQQNIEQIFYRTVGENLDLTKDIGAVFVYDNTSADMETPAAKLEDLLKKEGVKWIFGSELVYERGYGPRIAAVLNSETAGNGTNLSQSTDLMVDAAKAVIAEEGGQKNTLCVQSEDGKAGTLKKSFRLKPGTEYFYEYDLKAENASGAAVASGDILKVAFTTDNIPSNLQNPSGYQVTEIQKEDFNDSEVNSYFTLDQSRVKSGAYYGADLNSGETKNDSMISDSSSIKFEVEEGKEAVLSFDFDVSKCKKEDYVGSMVYIDGMPWEQYLNSSEEKGHYTHKKLLEAGEHTISMNASTYWTRPARAWVHIDSLRVDYLEQASENIPMEAKTSEVVRSEGQGGWFVIHGSIVSPQEIASYKEQETQRIQGSFGAAGSILEFLSERSNKYGTYDWQARINIPAGRTAVHSFLNISSYIESLNGTVQYSAAGKGWSAGINRVDRKLFYIPTGGQRIYLPILTGTTPVSYAAYPSREGSYASIGGGEIWLTGDLNESLQNGRFFIDASKEKIFAQGDKFTGKSGVSFEIPASGKFFFRNFKIYHMENGKKVYINEENLADSTYLQEWETTGVKTAVVRNQMSEQEDDHLVYKKGQLVAYNISYSDYENDPSKKQYWKYTHTPYNDGPHPDAAVVLDKNGQLASMSGKILSSSIPRFYVDGKYTVEHWQEDNTRRIPPDYSRGDPSGNPAYDKKSNVESLTFYIEGTATAPWITSIRTEPTKVKEGSAYKIRVAVDDVEKDVLSVTTEVYQNKKCIYTHRKDGLAVNSAGAYPAVVTDLIPEKAKAGTYQVVCTVSDQTGTGLETYKFTVVSDGKVLGYVNHTDQWDQNRKKYNLIRFKDEINRAISFADYRQMKEPRPRGTNVYWSGEKFLLRAGVTGEASQVQVQILGQGGSAASGLWQTSLKNSGQKNSQGETIWTGELWNDAMINRWGRKAPEQLNFRFTAYYEDGMTKTNEASVIVDSSDDYWQLHRLW